MSKQKKILFLSRYYYPHIGGVERHVKEISKILIRKGFKITIVTDYFNQNLKSEQLYGNIKVIRISYPEIKYVGLFILWFKLLKYIRLIANSDIVHVHDVFIWYLPFKLLFPRKKIFTTFHGYESFPVRKKNIIIRRFSEVLSTGSICIGEFMKKWYGHRPNFVSYGGVDVE